MGHNQNKSKMKDMQAMNLKSCTLHSSAIKPRINLILFIPSGVFNLCETVCFFFFFPESLELIWHPVASN